jgi:ribonuclease P protein component
MPTFSKAERITGKIEIEEILKNGEKVSTKNIRVLFVYKQHPSFFAKVVIVVPKRLHKKAVDRNRIKRLLRESYRLNKHLLYENKQTGYLLIMLSYTSKKIESFSTIQNEVIKAMEKLINLSAGQ